jgi:hypothetical protein
LWCQLEKAKKAIAQCEKLQAQREAEGRLRRAEEKLQGDQQDTDDEGGSPTIVPWVRRPRAVAGYTSQLRESEGSDDDCVALSSEDEDDLDDLLARV